MLGRLLDTLNAAGIPACAASGDATGVAVNYRVTLTAPQQTQADSVIAAFDWSQSADDAVNTAKDRAVMVAALSGVELNAKSARALLLMILDEFNLHAVKTNAILAAIDASTNYATLKTNIAAIADYPTRTKAQLVTAMTTKINAGAADA